MKPLPTVSVVIPCFNESHLTAKVIDDVQRTADLDYEFIVVDDGSTDDTEQVVKARDRVRYIKHEVNRGVSPAWNTGIKASSGDFVAILNNDIRIRDEHWMSRLVESVKAQKAIAGPELVDFNSAASYNGTNQQYLNGWMYIFPRRIFSELGLFEEAFAPASFEDVEFCSRAKYAGYRLQEVADLRVQHSYSATVGKVLRNELPRLNSRNRAIWLSKMASMDRRRLRIVFDCPSNGRKWGPYSLEEEGLGGAETALTLLTRELVSRGHEVAVFNDFAHSNTGNVGEGVTYFHRSMLSPKLECDVFVAFRCPSEVLPESIAKQKIFWSCDQTTTPPDTWDKHLFPHVGTTVCISDYHADFLAARHGRPRSRFRVIGCPVRSWDYEPHPEKVGGQFIFCSVPHRGLKFMPMVMREIRKELPEARLIITSDYRLWGAPDPRNEEFRALFHAPLDEFKGMVPRADLIGLQATSVAQPYPCTYEECQGIALVECASAGAVPVSTDIGAVRQTVGASGFIVGPPEGDFARRIAAKTLEIQGDRGLMQRAIEESWRYSVVSIGNLWEELLYEGIDREQPRPQEEVEWPAPRGDVPPGYGEVRGSQKGRPDLIEVSPGHWQTPSGDIISTRK